MAFKRTETPQGAFFHLGCRGWVAERHKESLKTALKQLLNIFEKSMD